MSLRIEWQHDGRRTVLPALILRPTPSTDLDGVQGRALLDTGATISGITPNTARQLGLTPRGKRPLGSARSEEQAERYLFRVGLVSSRGPADPPASPYVFDDIIGFELASIPSSTHCSAWTSFSQCDLALYRDGRCRLAAGRVQRSFNRSPIARTAAFRSIRCPHSARRSHSP